MVLIMVDLERLNKLTKELEEEFHNSLAKELAVEIHKDEDKEIFDLLSRILDKIKTQCMIIREDHTILYINSECSNWIKEHNVKLEVGMKWHSASPEYEIENCPHSKSIKERKVVSSIYGSPVTKVNYCVTAIPLLYDGVAGTICLIMPEEK